MARKRKRKMRGTKPVLRLGGGVFRVVLGPGLGDPAVWTGHLDAQGLYRPAPKLDAILQQTLAEVGELERMWEASDG